MGEKIMLNAIEMLNKLQKEFGIHSAITLGKSPEGVSVRLQVFDVIPTLSTEFTLTDDESDLSAVIGVKFQGALNMLHDLLNRRSD